MNARPTFFIGVQTQVSHQINSIAMRTTLCYLARTRPYFEDFTSQYYTCQTPHGCSSGSLRFRIYVISFSRSVTRAPELMHALILMSHPLISKRSCYRLRLNSRFSSVLAARDVSSQSFKDPECWSGQNFFENDIN